MNPQRSSALAICALLSCFFLACDNSESVPANANHPAALQGAWKEVHRANVFRFAGSDLKVTFGPDSVSIREQAFTDVSTCINTDGTLVCSDLSWENTYRGTWQADDSLLTVSFSFAGTTANRQTDNAKMQDGSYRMRYALRGASDMTLTARNGDASLPSRDTLVLLRD